MIPERSTTPERDARWEHLYRLLVKQEQDDAPDERTEADADAWQQQQAERAQAQDDAQTYG